MSISLNILSRSFLSSSFVKWLAIKAKAAYFNLLAPYKKIWEIIGLIKLLTLKFLRLFKVIFVMSLSINVSEYFLIQGCCRASAALIRSAGLNFSIYVTRSIASGDIVDHSSSSVWNTPLLTFLIICSSVAPLKGGYPHSKM
jgi:hypothetical protein